jgi:hypothetical protein
MGAVYVASFNMLRGLLGRCEATAGVTFAATALVYSVFVCLSLIAVLDCGRMVLKVPSDLVKTRKESVSEH